MTNRPSVSDWFDRRTGYRAGLRRLCDEPLPRGVNWWFTLGSVLLFLLVVQFVTGVALMIYYAPTPASAYDSVRFITTELTFGPLVRGLHFFGASFIVIAAALHLLRVLCFGAYKSPREVTWWTGIGLLLLILALALTGYLLPWDQRAYWATVVTINIARSTPLVGSWLAGLLQGGPDVGALTLSRWFTAHTVVLPGAVVLFVVAHLYLMRRHGIAGHFREREGPPRPFYPAHAIKDTLTIAAVFAALFSFAAYARVPLAEMADPSNASYTPRPEWYFVGLFELLKYFPGRLQPIAAHGIPALALLFLLALPFLDRGPGRHPRRRLPVLALSGVLVGGVVALTAIGLRDAPDTSVDRLWTVRAIAGRDLAASEACARCHAPAGVGPDLTRGRIARDDFWIQGHVVDPEMVAPGLRRPPRGSPTATDARAVVAYVRTIRAGAEPPAISDEDRIAAVVFGTKCIRCHMLDGEGSRAAPDLTHAANKPGRTAAWFEQWLTDPTSIEPFADMPAFGSQLSDVEMKAISNYLAKQH